MDTDGSALEATDWDVCHTLTTYATTTVIGMLAKGYGIDKANLKGFEKTTNKVAAYLHGNFLKADGAPNTKAELDKIIAIESVKKFLEGHYPGVALTATTFEKSFSDKELVFGTVKLSNDSTAETRAGVASLPSVLHTYLKLASKPGTATDITHLEQLIPAVAVNNTWKTALGDGTTAASNAVTTSGSEAIATGGQMETDKATTTLAATASTLITTKAMPYLQFVTDSSGTGAVVTADIKIEFKAADVGEGKWEKTPCKTVNDQTQLFDGVNPEILSSDVAIGKYKGALGTLFSNDAADKQFIPNGILYFIVVGGSSNTESQAYTTDIKASMKFTDSSTTQAAVKKANTSGETTAAEAPETGGDKGRKAGADGIIVSVVHVRDYTTLAGKELINKTLSNKIRDQ